MKGQSSMKANDVFSTDRNECMQKAIEKALELL